MAKVFTQEEREKLKGRLLNSYAGVGVRRYGNWKSRQVRQDIWWAFSQRELVASGDVSTLVTGYSRLNRRVRTGKMPVKSSQGQSWRNHLRLIRTLSGHYLTEKYVVTTGVINMICTECRKSEVMQRILSFYQGMSGIYWSDEIKVH